MRAKVRSVQSTPLIDSSGKLVGMVSTHYSRPGGPMPDVLEHVDNLAADFLATINDNDRRAHTQGKCIWPIFLLKYLRGWLRWLSNFRGCGEIVPLIGLLADVLSRSMLSGEGDMNTNGCPSSGLGFNGKGSIHQPDTLLHTRET